MRSFYENDRMIPMEGYMMNVKKVYVLITLLSIFYTCKENNHLWPVIEPYETGYLQVSSIHKIYYQRGGNPNGQSVMYLHGGPGGQCTPNDFRYFNPEKFNIVLHDQRGAGKSIPFAELQENTTKHLVDDIEKLRTHFKLGQILLFGGSWGSTLALAYAEKYPENVNGIILRGIFTATDEEIDHFYHGGAGKFFPAEYERLTTLANYKNEKNLPELLLQKFRSPDSTEQIKFARAWATYEGKIAFLEIKDDVVEAWFKTWNPLAFSALENHYMSNRCFLEPNQLLDNLQSLKDIPVIMINGRYDVICPPINAYRIHKELPHSQLYIVEKAGHSAHEIGIEKKLVEAVAEIELN